MKLTDFDKKPVETAQKALKEHYNTSVDVSKLSYAQVRTMLNKVRGLMSESKESLDYYRNENNTSYMKLVFMEQALSKQFAYLSANRPRIVVENEEVEKSQTILAAQDMVDSIQKMVEQVSDMIVKELPALVDSVQSEIGVNESATFQQQASEALTSLQAALTQSQTTMKEAVNGITGQGGMGTFGGEAEMGPEEPAGGEEEFSADISAEEPLAGGEEEVDLNMGAEEPEDVGSVGRAKR
jgi:hypothetical protein